MMRNPGIWESVGLVGQLMLCEAEEREGFLNSQGHSSSPGLFLTVGILSVKLCLFRDTQQQRGKYLYFHRD